MQIIINLDDGHTEDTALGTITWVLPKRLAEPLEAAGVTGKDLSITLTMLFESSFRNFFEALVTTILEGSHNLANFIADLSRRAANLLPVGAAEALRAELELRAAC